MLKITTITIGGGLTIVGMALFGMFMQKKPLFSQVGFILTCFGSSIFNLGLHGVG